MIKSDDGIFVHAMDNTWMFGHDPAFTINSHLREMPYDALRDFAPVSLLTRVPLLLVANPSLGLTDLAGLIALAQSAKLIGLANGSSDARRSLILNRRSRQLIATRTISQLRNPICVRGRFLNLFAQCDDRALLSRLTVLGRF